MYIWFIEAYHKVTYEDLEIDRSRNNLHAKPNKFVTSPIR